MASTQPRKHRRELFVAAAATLVGGGVAVVASTDGSPQRRAPHPPGVTAAQADVVLLGGVLAGERAEIAAYTALARSLPRARRHSLRLLAAQEQEHATAIAAAISDLGADAPSLPRLSVLEAAVPAPRHPRDAYEYLRRVEQRAIDTHLSAIVSLSTEDARATLTTILAVEGEHLALASARAGHAELSGPFAGVST